MNNHVEDVDADDAQLNLDDELSINDDDVANVDDEDSVVDGCKNGDAVADLSNDDRKDVEDDEVGSVTQFIEFNLEVDGSDE